MHDLYDVVLIRTDTRIVDRLIIDKLMFVNDKKTLHLYCERNINDKNYLYEHQITRIRWAKQSVHIESGSRNGRRQCPRE